MNSKTTLLAAALLAAVSFGGAARAQDINPTVLAGMQVYKSETGDCKGCHGWNGTGRNNDHPYASDIEAVGPSLVTTTMDRAAMIELVSCGKVGNSFNATMPQFLGEAWTPAHPCWGKLAADLPEDQKPLRAPISISRVAIENVVTYIMEVYQGKEMSWEWCSKYFDDYQRICEVWRDHGAQ